jgi:hypothetical protein
VEKQSVAATPKARKDVPIDPPKTNAETELRVREQTDDRPMLITDRF